MRSGRPQLLHVASLDVLGPLRDVDLVLVLHVLRESLDEPLPLRVRKLVNDV